MYFLLENIKIETIQEGDGTKALKGQNITVHYTGWLKSNGEKFDSSRDRKEPFHFTVGEKQVIRGWDQLLLQNMTLGSRIKAIIPPVRNWKFVVWNNVKMKLKINLYIYLVENFDDPDSTHLQIKLHIGLV